MHFTRLWFERILAPQHKYPLVLMEALLAQCEVFLLVYSLMHFVNENAI